MKIEPRDHSPKPLTKWFVHIGIGEVFRWEGKAYRYESCGIVLCIDDLTRHDWSYRESFEREVTILSPPDCDQWREFVQQHFKPKMVEPETVPVLDMEPGQVFVLPILDGGVDRYLRGHGNQIIRLCDGRLHYATVQDRGIPIDGKFVEEDHTA